MAMMESPAAKVTTMIFTMNNRRQFKMKFVKFLLKVIIVIFILFLLFEIIAPYFWAPPSYINKAKHDSTRSKMVPIETAIETFKQNTGKFPDKLEDLIRCPKDFEKSWQGPYLKESQLYDPWDKLYIYIFDPNYYQLISYGKDGKPGGKGYDADIYND
jgi:general secretion pathway protein G